MYIFSNWKQTNRVNNLPHHTGVSTTRGTYNHCKCSSTYACLFFFHRRYVRAHECVCPLSRTLEGDFLGLWSQQQKSKQAKQKVRQTEKYRERSVTEETEMREGWDRRVGKKKERGETECRSGLERLLHEGGLGSTANYAWHYWISCSACYILLKGVRGCTP